MLLLLLGTLIVILVLYLVNLSTKNFDHWEKRRVKYVKPFPFVGNLLPTVLKTKSTAELIQHLYKAFPNERFVGIFQFNTPILLIRDPELIKSIAIKNFDNFVDHYGFANDDIDPLWAKNLFASQGERWRDLRQTLSPVFTSSKMRTMFVLMDECVKQLTEYFKDQKQDVIDIELKDIFSRYTTDVIATTAFGIKVDSLRNRNNDFVVSGREFTDFSGLRGLAFFINGSYPRLAKFLNIKIVSDRLGNFFRTIIKETLTLREEKKIVRPDLIHSLMLARKGKLKYEELMELPEAGFAAVEESNLTKSNNNVNFLTDEDITAQALVFFLGGFDTTSSLMCFAGYELAINPHIQKRLKDEVLATDRECNGQITYEKLLNMKYLDMVVSETLRKWNQAVWLDRKCTKEIEIESETSGEPSVTLKVGDIIWMPAYAIHHDPKYYPNPELFDPERFSDENKDKIRTGTYLPFGVGPRNCIGSRFALLETKLLLYNLLLNFDLVTNHKTENPIKLRRDTPLLMPQNGFQVSLRKNDAFSEK
ncbi:cytochrome P450 9e2 [Tribolium castaneum]|uniref:Cytochrome P450 9AD1 n=1 Tax=Tribolium castaneum TaxID=7070 RepID=D6WBD3_TRICA|nr:PREDICTED: cytochrome P450 9e2 [Tribolium castaneum]EEZ99187.1 cytochrome P450 9AD1 [Tribolium castaneum]|eukprot:XP_973619.2 PREDICTED: cytochrome P450 9e2 [Tribolium castaneum]